jgi:cobalt transporter subunit CbtB
MKIMSHTITTSTAQSQSKLTSILFVAFLGLGIVFAAGYAQSNTLHDAAHDLRHATGFPCH